MTGPDNQRFETLLRRELKDDAPPARGDCPGPEQLAALWERSLSRSERALVESHIAGCARCQSAMAAMARAESDSDTPAAAHAPGLWWRVAAPAAVLIVVVSLISARLLRTTTSNRREQIAMALRHRLHRYRRRPAPVLTPAPPPSEKNRAPSGAAKVPPQAPEVVARAENALSQNPPPSPAKESAPAAREMSMRERPRAAQAERAQASAAASPLSRPSEGSLAPQMTSLQQRAPAASVQSPPAGSAVVASAPQATASLPAAARAGVAEEQARTAAAGAAIGARGAALEQGHGGQAATAKAVPAPGPEVSTNVLPGRATFTPPGLRPGFASFQSPPPVVAWNIGADGLIQRLGPGGWETLHSGTNLDLLAGSAPSAKVCWVAGKNGTLLRTVDGGDHWEPITPPAPVELVRIAASSADSASVTTADGRRFSTTDGGQDWSEE